MNPLVLLVLVFVFGRGGRRPYIWEAPRIPQIKIPKLSLGEPMYFDTFRMELLLDRLKMMTEMLERINQLSQMGIGEGDLSALMGVMGQLMTGNDGE